MARFSALNDTGYNSDFARIETSGLFGAADDGAADEKSVFSAQLSSGPAVHASSLLASSAAPLSTVNVRHVLTDSHAFVVEASFDVGRAQSFVAATSSFLASHIVDSITHLPLSPDASPTQAEETAFIAGVNSSSQIVATSFGTWNSDNPATFKATSSTAKWGAGAAGTAGGTVTYYFQDASAWTATEKAVFISGLTLWSDIANVQFAAAADAGSAQLTFIRGATGSGAFQTGTFNGSAGVGTPGTTNVWHWNADTSINLETTAVGNGFGPLTADPNVAGGHVWGTVVHEEGHEIGLGHGGAYNGDVVPATQQFSAQDTTLWTIMSYIAPTDTTAQYYGVQPVTGTDWGTTGPGGSGFAYEPTTWMPLDILAAQALYGLPTTTGLGGGQVFGFNSNIADATKPFFDFTVNTHPVITIWDMGTGNTLDLSGFSAASNINLNAGSFNSCDGMVNNIAIAAGTVINTFVGGSGNDTVQANNNGDLITAGAGNDTLTGGTGNDGFGFGAFFTTSDSVNGGAGTNDQIGLQGDYSGGLVLSGAQISGIEVAALLLGFNYSITTTDNLVGAGATFTEWSVSMAAANTVSFNASADTDSNFHFYLGQGNDTAIGGAGADLFYGEGGADTLRGNGGADTFAYRGVADSTGSAYDTIQDFVHGTDKFLLGTAVSGVDATVASGALSTASFDVNLATAVDAGHLAIGHAVLFTPDSGTLAAHTFLVVDANGTAGYQAGADFVFDVTGGTLAGLATTDFI
jgi:serralysin